MARVAASVFLVAGVLAVAVAPSALASHTTEVQVHSATLGLGGSLSVSGSIECTEGYTWFLTTTIRQKAGKTFNIASSDASATCSTTGSETWTTRFFFGSGPFKSGSAVAETFGSVCDPDFTHCPSDSEVREIRIRK